MLMDGRRVTRPLVEEADAVIVGSGAGGAPMARRLARAGKNVLMVEEGGRFTVKDFNRDSYDMTKKMYRGMATMVTLGRPGIPLPLGKTYGGTTTINSGTCFRLPAKVSEHWRTEFGLVHLTDEYLQPFFDEVERTLHVEEVPWDTMSGGNQVFAEGMKKLGYHGGPLRRNQIKCRGAGVCALGCPNDAKRPMHLNYLPQAEEAGAQVWLHSKVDSILTVGGKAIGVSGLFQNEEGRAPVRFSIRAKVVILAAGTIGTPHLLLRNRMANSSGHVGRHLRIHPSAKLVSFMDRDVKAWSGVPQAYYCDQFSDEGLMMEGFFIAPSLLAFSLPASGARLKHYMSEYNKMATFGVMVSDTSEGRVRALPLNPDPIMTYELNRRDTESFVKGIKIAARIFFEAGAKKVLPPVFGVEEIRSPDEIDRLLDPARIQATDLELIAFHPMGTCRMAADPRMGVVDGNLECHDVRHLFVADGSIFPSSLGVNPQESIMAFSEMAAQRMLEAERRYFA